MTKIHKQNNKRIPPNILEKMSEYYRPASAQSLVHTWCRGEAGRTNTRSTFSAVDPRDHPDKYTGRAAGARV